MNMSLITDFDKNDFLKAMPTSIGNNNNNNNNSNNMNRINQLDSEFDQHLANMKKYILELKEKKCNI